MGKKPLAIALVKELVRSVSSRQGIVMRRCLDEPSTATTTAIVEPSVPSSYATRLASLATIAILAVVHVAASAPAQAADEWSPPIVKTIDDWAECLRAADPDQRAKACTAIIGKTKDRRSLIRAYNGRGNALCATTERCHEAVPDFTSVVKLAPDVAGYHDNLARALRAALRYHDALQESDRAIALAPRLTFVYVGKAKTLAAAKRGDEAVRVIETAMALAPQDASLLEYDGKVLGDLKRFPESYAAFDKALKMQPQRFGVYVRRADVEAAEGRTAAAIGDLEHYPADGNEEPQVRQKLRDLRNPPPAASAGTKASEAADAHVPSPAPGAASKIVTDAQKGPAEIPKRFRGLWVVSAGDKGFVCSESLQRDGVVTSDERSMIVTERSIAHSESGCKIAGVGQTSTGNADEADDAVTMSTICEGEGETDHRRELWALRQARNRELLIITDLDHPSVSTYERCTEASTATSKKPTLAQNASAARTDGVETLAETKIDLGDVQCGSDRAIAALREYLAAGITGGGNQFTMFVPIEQNRRIIDRLISFKDIITLQRGPEALLCSATSLIGTTPSAAIRYELRVTDDGKTLVARELK